MANVGRVQTGLYLAPEPGVMLGCHLLLLHELAHEVAQELRASAIARLRGSSELVFQGLIDSKGESCLAHDAVPMCCIAFTG